MIHGFDDSTKEKVEVYSKGDFVIIEGQTTIEASSGKAVTIDFTQYSDLIVNKYRILSVNSNHASQWYSPFEVNNDGCYPNATLQPTSTVIVRLYNYAQMEQNIKYCVILLRVSD